MTKNDIEEIVLKSFLKEHSEEDIRDFFNITDRPCDFSKINFTCRYLEIESEFKNRDIIKFFMIEIMDFDALSYHILTSKDGGQFINQEFEKQVSKAFNLIQIKKLNKTLSD